MPGDSFVPDKIDNQLTASPLDFAVANARIFYTRRLRALGRQKQ